MSRTVLINGRMVSSRLVELDSPLPEGTRQVKVLATVGDRLPGRLSDYLRGLPPGERSKEEIDRQIHEERGSWSRCAAGPGRGHDGDG